MTKPLISDPSFQEHQHHRHRCRWGMLIFLLRSSNIPPLVQHLDTGVQCCHSAGMYVLLFFLFFFQIIEGKKQHTVLLWATQLALCGCVRLLLSSPQVPSKDSSSISRCKDIGLLPVFMFIFELSVEWPLQVQVLLKSFDNFVEHNAIGGFFHGQQKCLVF